MYRFTAGCVRAVLAGVMAMAGGPGLLGLPVMSGAMSPLLLHHYPDSAFSEKTRLMLGFKGLQWTSVRIPEVLPKPDVMALTGGYRKTPLLQVGADIYCDTALIADVLERLAPTPPLYPRESEGLARILAQWADSTLFWTVLSYAFQPAGLQNLFKGAPPELLKAFLEDRAAFCGDLQRLEPREATGALTQHVERLGQLLADGRPWLLGQAASIADFCVYHGLWLLRRARLTSLLDAQERLTAWEERVQALGHGTSDVLESARAVEFAASSTPASTDAEPFLPMPGLERGARVTIRATDYGTDPVEGELVLSRPNELALRRVDPRAGEIVVHFPRLGFQVKKVG